MRRIVEAIDVSRSIPGRVKASKHKITDFLSPALVNGLVSAETGCYIVDNGYSSFLPIKTGLIIISMEQAVNIATKYKITVSQACEAITLHELGHATMAVARVVDDIPPGVSKERLAWLLGRVFLNLTTIPPQIYTQMSIELT